jgi:hypothetical protein
VPVQRICAGCQQTDDAPRHVFAVGPAQVPPMPWHMDCHVTATGCETCADQLRQCDNAKNDELRERLIALRNDDTQEN